MKSTGVVRKIDELGRIVLPKPLREVMDLKERIPSRFSRMATASSCKNITLRASSAAMQTT